MSQLAYSGAAAASIMSVRFVGAFPVPEPITVASRRKSIAVTRIMVATFPKVPAIVAGKSPNGRGQAAGGDPAQCWLPRQHHRTASLQTGHQSSQALQ